MSNNNVLELPYQEEEVILEAGDFVMMLKPGGGLKVMTLGLDQDLVNGLIGRDVESFTPEEKDIYDRGETMFLLTMAHESQEIMELLVAIKNSDGESRQDKFNNVVRIH